MRSVKLAANGVRVGAHPVGCAYMLLWENIF